MSTAIEKLEKVIEAQDEEISELNRQIEAYENSKDWQVTRITNEQKMAEEYVGYDKLPFPRLEMRVRPLDDNWYSIEWLYGFVYRHYDGEVLFIPFSRTTGSGSTGAKMREGKLDTPMRDGLHIRTDMNLFNVKGYIICNGIIKPVEEVQKGYYKQETLDQALKEMKRE